MKNGKNEKKKGWRRLARVARQPVVEEKGEGRRARWPVVQEKGKGTEISSNFAVISLGFAYKLVRHSGRAGLPSSGLLTEHGNVYSSRFGTQNSEPRGQTVSQGGRSAMSGKSRHTQTCAKYTGSHRQSQGFQRFTGSGLSGKSHALIPKKSQNAVIQTCEGTGVIGKTFEGVDIRHECVNTTGIGFEGVSCESGFQTSEFESILNPRAAEFIVNNSAVVSSNEYDMLNQIDSNAEGPLTTEQAFVHTNEGLVEVSIQSLSEQKKEDLINGLVTRVLDLSAEIQKSDQHYDFRSSNVQYFQFDELEEEKMSYIQSLQLSGVRYRNAKRNKNLNGGSLSHSIDSAWRSSISSQWNLFSRRWDPPPKEHKYMHN